MLLRYKIVLFVETVEVIIRISYSNKDAISKKNVWPFNTCKTRSIKNIRFF